MQSLETGSPGLSTRRSLLSQLNSTSTDNDEIATPTRATNRSAALDMDMSPLSLGFPESLDQPQEVLPKANSRKRARGVENASPMTQHSTESAIVQVGQEIDSPNSKRVTRSNSTRASSRSAVVSAIADDDEPQTFRNSRR